jgi:hypothetical protein
MLDDGVKGKSSDMRVMDIAQVVGEAVGLDEQRDRRGEQAAAEHS